EAAGWRKVFDDPRPAAYLVTEGGRKALPPFAVYENLTAFPRAFVVPQALPLPERAQVLPTVRKLTSADFKQTVFLEGFTPRQGVTTSAGKYRKANVITYEPNRVTVSVGEGNAGGYLVLADIWFPGWTCTVDGNP